MTPSCGRKHHCCACGRGLKLCDAELWTVFHTFRLENNAHIRMDGKRRRVTLSVHPSRGLVDEPFIILAHSLQPGSQVTVHSLHQCEDGHSWEAFGHYAADATGTVNVAEDASLGGTYSGVEQMALLWSLRPVPGSKPGLRLRKRNVQTPMKVTVSVYEGHRTEGFVGQAPLASVEVERWYMAPGVRRVPVTEDGLVATLFLPSGPGPFSGVLDLWGGGGKLVEYRAALLASRGFASLALDYLTPENILDMVGTEYFEAAVGVLQRHPQVVGSRVAVLGLSLGASAALKLAAYSRVAQPRCAVCISGTHVQPVDGSLADILTYCSKNAANARFSEEHELISRHLLLPLPTDASLKVDVARIRCPVLLVVGEDDQNWPAHESAMDMKEMMERAGNGHLLTILSYPNAGHLIEPPYAPLTRSSIVPLMKTAHRCGRGTLDPGKAAVLWGGEVTPHSSAQEDSWRKTLAFLREHLCGGRDPAAASSSHL